MPSKNPTNPGIHAQAAALAVIFEFSEEVLKQIQRIPGVAASPRLNRLDAAAYCGCSPAKIDAMRMSGRLKPKYFGDAPMYAKADLEKIIEEDTKAATKKRALASSARYLARIRDQEENARQGIQLTVFKAEPKPGKTQPEAS